MRTTVKLIVVLVVMTSTLLVSPHRSEAVPAARQGSFPIQAGAARASAEPVLPWRANIIGVSWASEDREATGVSVSARTFGDDGWGPWFDLHVLPDEGPDRGDEPRASERVFTEPVWVGTVSDVEVSVATSPGAARVSDVRVEAINTLGDADRSPVVRAVRSIGRFLTARSAEPARADALQPRIITRAEWGADESLRTEGPGKASEVRLAIVHHTAGSNSYSRSEAKAVVRGVYRYHTLGRGYSDIAYNFLVDRYGRIYEGRAGGITEPQIGAHAGGFNTYSTGVALMGEFTNVAPPTAMVNALVRLLAWKLDVHHVRPDGMVYMVAEQDGSRYDEGTRVRLHRIAAHRHTNSTACPGSRTMTRLASIRERVTARGQPKIYFPSLSASAIRPSTDLSSTVRLRARFSRSVNWTWRIIDAGGATVATLRGTGGAMTATWDGRVAGGAAALPGRYDWRLDARGPRGHLARPVTGRLDVLAPIARGCPGCSVVSPSADFDGDGFSDLAIGVPGEDIAGVVDAGGVNVLYGSASGLSGAGDQFLSERRLAVGDAGTGDGFGSSLAAADFDGDGFDDLAIGVPGEDFPDRRDAGAVVIVPGSASGLDLDAAVLMHQDSHGIIGVGEEGDGFATALAAGDLSGDGFAELVIGSPGEDIGSAIDGGMVTVLTGTSDGLESRPGSAWSQRRSAVPGGAESYDSFGASLSIGDLDGDNVGDLVIGVPGEAIGSVPRAGMLVALRGGPGGPRTTGAVGWHQGIAGSPDQPEAGDAVGFALATGDVDGDGFDDIVAGAPGEELGAVADAGAIVLVRGGEGLLAATGDQILHRGLDELGGEESPGDSFGASVTLADFDADGNDDVAVGIPGDDVGSVVDAGSVTVIEGSDGGLLGIGGSRWHLGTAGVKGVPAAGNLYGWALTTGDHDGDGHADLVVAVPGMDVGSAEDAGAVSVLPGSDAGLTAAGDAFFTQASDGVIGAPEDADLFGAL